MTEVVNIRFREQGKVYYFDPAGTEPKLGEHVIVETAKGMEYGECMQEKHQVEDSCVVPPLRPVVRIATPEDVKNAEDNRTKEGRAMEVCQKKIEEHKLDMKLVDVEYSFDGSKILFFFTSDGRVDFRELVKDLASVFRARIELRQIGVRDSAKLLGGLGICGRPFCCASFLDDFQPVSIKMAKTQSLSLNPVKISGTCGRLMCCLKYEQEAYEDLVKHLPKNFSLVNTPSGVGTVMDCNCLRQTVRVRMDGPNTDIKSFSVEEIDVLRSGKARPDDPAIKLPDGPVKRKKVEAPTEEPEKFVFADGLTADDKPEQHKVARQQPQEAEQGEPKADKARRRRRPRRRKKPSAENPGAKSET